MGLRVYYTNDMHNRTAALDLLERRPDRESALLLDGGDALRGSNTAFYRHEPVLQRMRRLGFRAMAMGNRELHYLRRVMGWRTAERGFPLLAANLEDLRCARDDWQAGTVVACSGVRVGLVGATVVQFPVGSPWEKLMGLRFHDPARTLPPVLEEMRPRCDLLILLSHLGLPADRELVPRLPAVDLVLGGHSHDVTEQPLPLGRALLAHGGSHSRYLAELNIELEPLRVDWKLHVA